MYRTPEFLPVASTNSATSPTMSSWRGKSGLEPEIRWRYSPIELSRAQMQSFPLSDPPARATTNLNITVRIQCSVKGYDAFSLRTELQ